MLQKAIEALKNGQTILYPTDTVWGLGCDATNPDAVERLIKLKNRPADKSFIILLDNDLKLNRYVKEVPDIAWDLIEHSTKPTTIIYPTGYNLANNVLNQNGSIAVRIVKEGPCHDLLKKFGKPIVSTSANISNEPNPKNFKEISPAVLEQVDYILNLPDLSENATPSTIIRLEVNGEIEFIRK